MLRGIVLTLSVCLCVCPFVCLCVCPARIFRYFSAFRRDIDLKFIQDKKTWARREMTSQKIRQYLIVNMENSYTEDTISHTIVNTNLTKDGSHTAW